MSQPLVEMVTCPSCGTSWLDGEIPEKDRELYGGLTHFTRLVGISDGDSVLRWRCPDCAEEWEREDLGSLPGFRTCPVVVIGELGEELSTPPPQDAVASLRGLLEVFGLDLNDVIKSKWDDPERES